MKQPTHIDDLQGAAYNPRQISEAAAEGLSNSLAEFGDISGIVWNSRTGRLVAGHQRVGQLRKQGAQWLNGALQVASGERYPVRVVDWPEAKEKAANIAANNAHIGGEFTPDLGPLLEEVRGSIGEGTFESLALDKLLTDVPRAPDGLGDAPATDAQDDGDPAPRCPTCGAQGRGGLA